MNKTFKALLIIFLSLMLISPTASAENKWERLVDKCGTVLEEVQKMPDEGIPVDLLRKCYAVAIFPDTISAGIGIGGKYGQGIIIVRGKNKNRWSSPAIFTIAGGSLGWQIGGQSTDIVLLIMSEKSVDGILHGKFKLGADAAVAAGPVGRDAQAATDAKLGGLLSYSRTRGLFIGVKLEGDVLTEHWDGNDELYGTKLSAEEILLKNKAKMPPSAKKVMSILKKYPFKK